MVGLGRHFSSKYIERGAEAILFGIAVKESEGRENRFMG